MKLRFSRGFFGMESGPEFCRFGRLGKYSKIRKFKYSSSTVLKTGHETDER